MPTTFPPLNQITIVPATTGPGGAPLPSGETEASITLGIRPDGDAAHGPGNYGTLVVVPPGQTTESLAALNAAIGSALAPGNYWLNGKQTDTYQGANFTSAWGATEVPFSIPLPGAAPDAPQLSVS